MNSPSVKQIKKNQLSEKRKQFLASSIESIKAYLARSPVTSSVMFSVFFYLLTNVVCGLWVWQEFIVRERQNQMEAAAEQNARIAAANVANYLLGAHKRLDYFTSSSSLVTALRYQDPAGVLEIEKALRNSFPKAISIRVFGVGRAVVDLDGDPPLSFAEVENIRMTERREQVIPEAVSIDGSDWRINIVVPVAENDAAPVLGSILITLPISEIYKTLRQGLDDLGKVSLYQTFDNKPRLMGSFGKGELYKAKRIDVPDSPWQVEFTASEKLLSSTQIDLMFILIVSVIVSLASLACFVFVGLTVGRSISKKQFALADTHKKMGRGKFGRVDDRTSDSDNLLNVKILAEDRDLLGLSEEAETAFDPLAIDDLNSLAESNSENSDLIPAHIFRSYDIRGVANTEITKELALDIGKALGSEAQDQGESTLIIARDARIHSPILMENLIRGVLSTGCRVLNIGTVPTPLLYFATEILEQSSSGVMITASHSPAEFNGFKVVMKGKPRTEEDIKAVRARIIKRDYRQGIGSEESVDVIDRYIDTIFSDVALAGDMRIVIDAGSGVTGKVAPRLFDELGCEVVPLHCDLDGNFPHHGPDPSVEANLQDLIKKVKETSADLGVAFDGDGDRLAVVTPLGEIIWPDRLLMLFAKDILARNPGADVVFDVKSSRQLNTVISSNGGRPIMWKTGHAPMRAKVAETGALVGGEFSGHIFIKDRWYGFDDGMYAAARLIEIMSLRDENLDEIFAEFPPMKITPEYRFPIAEENKFNVVEQLVQNGDFGEAKIITLDGLRAEYSYGWGLVRASNTGAELTMRFEAESDEQLHQLKALFTREIRKIDSTVEIKW